tara:strand:- start:409 stop:873 length:465 start_codon:yes stop_codon:yes gene_type:complete
MGMINKADIVKIAEPKIIQLGGYLVDVKVSNTNVITILFDIEGGSVLVEHCLAINKHIEEKIDREIEDYELNISSPGLSNPFLVPKQYHKNIGKEVKVLLQNGEREKGTIISYADQLVLEVEEKVKGKKGPFKKKSIHIPCNQIKETKLKLNFK